MSNKIISNGQPINNLDETKCPWCKNKVPVHQVDVHKATCTDRRPAPTITVIDPAFITNQPHMQ